MLKECYLKKRCDPSSQDKRQSIVESIDIFAETVKESADWSGIEKHHWEAENSTNEMMMKSTCST